MRTDEYPEVQAVKVWEHNGVQLSILQTKLGHYCGYCRFKERLLVEPSWNGIAAYVPVHGGITYVELSDDGSIVYGFDCSHLDDEHDPKLRDLEWLGEQCWQMAQGVHKAAEFEAAYLACNEDDSAARIAVLDLFHKALEASNIKFSLHDNGLTAMMNVITGRL